MSLTVNWDRSMSKLSIIDSRDKYVNLASSPFKLLTI